MNVGDEVEVTLRGTVTQIRYGDGIREDEVWVREADGREYMMWASACEVLKPDWFPPRAGDVIRDGGGNTYWVTAMGNRTGRDRFGFNTVLDNLARARLAVLAAVDEAEPDRVEQEGEVVMADIGDPVREIEVWPLEEPVTLPVESPAEEPVAVPA